MAGRPVQRDLLRQIRQPPAEFAAAAQLLEQTQRPLDAAGPAGRRLLQGWVLELSSTNLALGKPASSW